MQPYEYEHKRNSLAILCACFLAFCFFGMICWVVYWNIYYSIECYKHNMKWELLQAPTSRDNYWVCR